MKLYYEENRDVTFEQEINEASGHSKYKISGIFSTIGEKNKNGRVYPANIWEREVKEYQSTLAKGASNSLMELNHPPRANVDMMEAVAKIHKLYISDDKKYVMGEAVLLDNPKANQLKTLIDAGIKMSVSSRGVGKVSASGVVENFKLSTYDIIPDQGQSDYNAEMMGIVEGVLAGKEFEILDNGCIGECELPTFDTEASEPLVESKEITEMDMDSMPNIKNLKGCLNKVGAKVLCDLDHDMKEAVLQEFADNVRNDLKESFKEYEAYVVESFDKLNEKIAELEQSELILKDKEEQEAKAIVEKKEKAKKALEAIKAIKI